MKKITIQSSFAVLILVSVFSAALAAGGGGKDKSKYAPIIELLDDEQYQKAIDTSKKALLKSPDNPDLFNYIAYSHRNLGQFADAFVYYFKALEIDPGHRGANEYLGELYLQTGQLAKAQERLQVLDKECFFPCGAYRDLKKAIGAYQKENPS
ncbi:MAG: tetratricopeptide repeat protein [Gammaproteobacteria bacterium]